MNKTNENKILQSTIKWLEKGNNFNISLHDISGILHNNPILKIDKKNQIHNNSFCEIAKSTPSGLRFCLKCKSRSIKKALKIEDFYIGHCYLGITEIVKPVYWKEKPLCIIYLGQFIIKEQLPMVKEKIEKNSKISGVKKEKLYQQINSIPQIEINSLKKYKEIINILEHQIYLVAANKVINIQTNNKPASPIYTKTKNWVVDSVQLYINKYYNKNLKLSQLADLFFIHPHYLSKLFKKETGENFTNYVNRIRIQNSKNLLKRTDDKIINISMQVGFNNVTYFNRVFKEYTGLTPGEYRRKS